MKNIKFVAAITAVLVVSVTLASLLNSEASAQEETPFPSREKTISVTGTATTKVEPDLLHIQFGVETQEKTANEALQKNSELMSSVIEAVKGAGIVESELSTSSLNIYPVYDQHYDELTNVYTQNLIGYRVSNVLSVDTKKLDTAASIIDNAVNAGANRVDSVFFTLSPETHLKIKDDLLEKAINNAKSKAEKALVPLDHSIIGVKSVSLSEFAVPYPMPVYRAEFAMYDESAKMAPTQVFTSDQDVTTTASVVFTIGSN
jgi:uncharacterized protein YggE